MESVTSQIKRPPGSPRRSTISSMAEAKREDDARLKERAEKLSEALDRLVTHGRKDGHTSAELAALAIPCFFHKRFDDAVNIEKILEEIAGDEAMSHSTLMQTATGVREVSRQLQRRPIKRAVRNVMIVTKARDNQLVYLTRDLAEWLLATPRYGSRVGVNVYVDEKLRMSKRFDAAGMIAREPRFEKALRYWTPELCWGSPEKFDLVLTLGGDGTVLYTSWLFQRIVPPVLSFSLGSLGFLTTFDFYRYREHLNYVMGGLDPKGPYPPPSGTRTPAPQDIIHDAGMRVNLRMRFTCTVHRAPTKKPKKQGSSHSSTSSPAPSPITIVNGSTTASPLNSGSSEGPIQFEVLNELVIDRGPSPYVSNLELFSGEENTLITVIQADGVIFSTPTGSTAYSLSAGGSLVHPDIPAILLTPICPHTLSFRPMLLNDTMALRVAVPKNSRATAYCSFDGKSRIELRQGDYVTINASRYPFPTVVGGKMEWLDSVSRTLRWNTREATQKGWSGKNKKRSGAQVENPVRARSRRVSAAGLDDESLDADSEDAQSDIMIGHDDDDDDTEDDVDPSDQQFDIDFNKEESQGVSSKELLYRNTANGSTTTMDSGLDSPFRKAFSGGLSSTATPTAAV